MKKLIREGYVKFTTDLEEHLPFMLNKDEYKYIFNTGLWDKVRITIEILPKEDLGKIQT